ncbi:hypothetical protein [Actinotalea sp. K2]|uniref:hypothetical protein n=1 Tax=Actinotalea sp. K2 TaxID=2939438 RepID=UPI002018262E|nr:hypothetical protein [Actinotalea sp. K2]MCL3860472.1 hypothetical protein [Actinotalea sp. K2]
MSPTTRIGRAGVAFAVLGPLLLAACAPPLPEPTPDAEPAVVQAALSTDQVERVVEQVAAVLAEADAGGSAETLDPRVTGPAEAVRSVEYRLAAAGVEQALTPVPEGIQTIVVPATTTWPRTVMVVTEPPEDLQAPLLLTLVQPRPREAYELWSWVRLFPGVQMPATTEPGLGSPTVPGGEESGLLVPPEDVIPRYVDVLTSGTESEHAATFAEDPMRAQIVGVRDSLSASLAEQGSLVETYQPAFDGVTRSLATADGGAVVVGAVETVTTITLDDSTLTLGAGETVALLGGDTITESLTTTWLSMVAFYVPPAGSSDPVVVLGGEHTPTEVTGQ